MQLTKHKKGIQGFTLVEIMVVLALFTAIITIATGALFSAQAINARMQQNQIILDGVNLALEAMTRDMRYGSIFYCDTTVPSSALGRKDCLYPTGGNVLSFRPSVSLTANDSVNDRIVYYLSGGSIYRQLLPEGTPAEALQVTPPDVSVTSLQFYLKGSEAVTASNYVQPVVTIVVSGVTKPSRPNVSPIPFSFQTTTSIRKLDK